MGIQINGQTDTISAFDNSFSLAGNVSIGGTLTYEDVTSVDAVGLSTFQAGIHLDDSIIHLGDTNTKIRFPAADTITAETAGSERLRITSTGDVGINKNAPTSVLDVRQTNTGAATEIKLFNLDQSNATTQTAALVMTPDVRANGVKIVAVKEVADMSSTANKDLALSFQTVANNTAAERLRITSAGKFGLGLTPSMFFEVFSNENDIARFSGPNSGNIVFRNDTSNEIQIHTGTSDALIFGTNGENERLRIDANGSAQFKGGNAPSGRDTRISRYASLLVGYNTSQSGELVSNPRCSIDAGNGNIRTEGYIAGGIAGSVTPAGKLYVRASDECNFVVREEATSLVLSAETNSGRDSNRLMTLEGNGLVFNSGGSEKFRIQSNGRVGINRVTSSFMLDIVGNSSTGANCIRIVDGAETGHGSHPAKISAGGTYYQEMQMHSRRFAVHTWNGSNIAERFRVHQDGNIGINCNSPGSMLELNAAAGTKMGISLGAVGDTITASRYIGICKTADQTDLGANSGFQGIEFGGPYSTNEGYLAFHTHDLGVESGERMRLTKDGKFGVGLTSPEAKVQIRNTTTHGKDTYATANTGGSQTPPPPTFQWDNVTPVAGHGRGYEAWVQSGDAYPNASNYIDVLIRNSGFYRITLKRSHSSADAAVCQMMIYGLANSGNSNYPVVHMNGAMGSGTSTATVQSGNGRGSSNAVASFYWEIHSYNINTHDTIIRITTTGSNNQGIVALIEQI